MAKNSKIKKEPSVFNYKYFLLALAVPLALGCTLMIFIWCNDNLSLEWPSKKSLDTFLTYMSVPLWVMGSSIPLATLAAANFRAIQFQENLNFQKRNIERQEYEHALDIYHKELDLFKDKLSSLLPNARYQMITPQDSTVLFTRIYKKPSKSEPGLTYNEDIVNMMFSYTEAVHTVMKSILGCKSREVLIKSVSFQKLKLDHDIFTSLNLDGLRAAVFLARLDEITQNLCFCLGLKQNKLASSSILDSYRIIYEISKFYETLDHHCIDDKYKPNKEHLIEINEKFTQWQDSGSLDLELRLGKK